MDNAPMHRANDTKQFLSDNHVRVMEDWPSESPDLNVVRMHVCFTVYHKQQFPLMIMKYKNSRKLRHLSGLMSDKNEACAVEALLCTYEPWLFFSFRRTVTFVVAKN
jgi:hypothetical protein